MENHFNRLPTELVISIFDIILDAKCLCICYSLSKYFAAHVLQTRFVSVDIPYVIDQKSGGPRVWPPGVMNFVKKLCCVESATIKFSLRDPNPSSSQQIFKPLVCWKSDSFGFISVSAKNRVSSSNDDVTSIVNHLRKLRLRFRYIRELLTVLPNLKKISAVDSMKQGSLVLEEEGIASMENVKPLEDAHKLRKKPWEIYGKLCVKLWKASKLKLPVSGCVMKNVTLVLIREIGACDDLIVENLLEESEYREVAMTILF